MRHYALFFLLIVVCTPLASGQVLYMRWNYTLGGALEDDIDIKSLHIHDIDDDEFGEVVASSAGRPGTGYTKEKNGVYAIERDGTLMWNYQIDDVVKFARITDLDKDGNSEIIAISGQTLDRIQRGTMHMINHVGRLIRSFTSTTLLRCIDVTDLDGDKYYELVSGSTKKVKVTHIYGEPVWEYLIDHPVNSVLAVDLNGDDTYEVIAGSKELYYFDKDGNLLATFPIDENEPELHRNVKYLAPANLSGTRYMDVIAVSEKDNIYAVQLDSYRESRGIIRIEISQKWKADLGCEIVAFLKGNLDMDNYDEFVIGCSDNNIYTLDNTGDMNWQYKLNARPRSIYMYDVDNDKVEDVLVATAAGTIYALDNYGNFKWRYDTHQDITELTASEMDNDNLAEIVVGTTTKNVILYSVNNSYTKKQKAESYFTKGQQLYINGEYEQSQQQLYEARKIFVELGEDQGIQKTMSLLDKIFKRLTEERGKRASLYYEQAMEKFIQGEYEQSTVYATQARDIFHEFGDSENVLKCDLLILRIESIREGQQPKPVNITRPAVNNTVQEEQTWFNVNFNKIIGGVVFLLVIGLLAMVAKNKKMGGGMTAGEGQEKVKGEWGEIVE